MVQSSLLRCIPDISGDGRMDVLLTHGLTAYALSGVDGATVWFSPLPQAAFAASVLADSDGDGKPDVVLVVCERSTIALELRTGDVFARIAGGQQWSGGIDSGAPLSVHVPSGRRSVCRVEVRRERPLGGWHSGSAACVDPEVVSAGLALSASRRTRARPAEAMADCLAAARRSSNTAAVHLVLMAHLRHVASAGGADEIRASVAELRRMRADDALVHAADYLCGGSLEALTAALSRDAVGTCVFLWPLRSTWAPRASLIRECAARLSGIERIAALVLAADYDLALADIHSLDARSESPDLVEAARALLPVGAAPFLDRAKELAGEPARAAALGAMAFRVASPKEVPDAAEVTARAYHALGRRGEAIALLEEAVRRCYVGDAARLKALRDEIGR
jgi:hypothetical protein